MTIYELTCLHRLRGLLRCLKLPIRDKLEQLYRKRCRYSGGVSLPPLVLVRVGIIANATYHQTRKTIHQTRGLHLYTQTLASCDIPENISSSRIIDETVS